MADIIVDLLMKNKNADGSFSILHPITKTGNVKTSKEIEVMLPEAIGSFKPGDKIQPETSLDDIIKKLVQVQILPTYTEPTASIAATVTKAGSFEAGTTLTPTLTATFTQNDAGALTKLQILKNGTEVASGTDSTLTKDESFVIGVETVKYKATATYGDGAIKPDNFGNPYGDTSIKAGSKTSSEISYTGYRTYFASHDAESAAATTSANVRDFVTKGTKAAANGVTFTISAKAGDTRVTFAYPSSLREVSSVKYVEAGNDESKGLFTETKVDVEGAGGFEATEYRVYTMIGAQPFLADMTFNVTI
jgi:hypothetical protein